MAKDGRGDDDNSLDVWLFPGRWQDVWDGSIVSGPQTIHVTQPYSRLPMWHKRDGGMLIICDKPALRIADQDWSSLTLEVFPTTSKMVTLHRPLYERDTADRTDITLRADGNGRTVVEIGDSKVSRAWVVRFHLLPSERVTAATVEGRDAMGSTDIHFIAPRNDMLEDANFFPFAGAGTAPASKAGPVAELQVMPGFQARTVDITIRAVIGDAVTLAGEGAPLAVAELTMVGNMGSTALA